MRWEGYSYTSQTISELMAFAAPTRSFLVPSFSLYNVLVIAFGIGVWASAGGKGGLRLAGMLLAAYGVVGFAGLLLFPIQLRGTQWSAIDTGHIVVTIVNVILMPLFMWFGAAARGRGFRLYSVATIVTVFLFGALAGMQGPRASAQLPTPWLGVMERICVYSFMLWVLVFAVALLRDPAGARRE